MTIKLKSLLPLFFVLASCGTEDVTPLAASEVTVFAPLPGQSIAVAYFFLHNRTEAPIVVTSVSSPEFTSVEMHTTIFGNGISEMLPIDSVSIAGQSEIEFAAAGKHLMLMGPSEALEPGDDVTLEFHYGSDGLLVVHSRLQARLNGPERGHKYSDKLILMGSELAPCGRVNINLSEY